MKLLKQSRFFHKLPASTYIIAKYLIAKNIFLWIAWAVVLFASCRTDEPIDSSTPDSDTSQVLLNIYMPGLKPPSTRATNDEAVHNVAVLLFKKDHLNIEKVMVMKTLNPSDIINSGGVSGNVLLRLGSANTDTYTRIVIVANATDALTANNIQVGSTYDALKTTSFGQNLFHSSSGQWTNAPGIPLYGEYAPAGGIVLQAGVSSTLPTIPSERILLYRTLARIDVKNNATTDGFTLTKVHLCNSLKQGLLHTDLTKYNAGQPNLPTTVTNNISPATYTPALGMQVLENAIYACEQASGSISGSIFSGPRIVIEGTYNGATCFYPADFTSDGTRPTGGGIAGNFVPILRNHKYLFTISAVKFKGYNTLQEALQTPEQLTNGTTITLTTINNGEYENFLFNETTYLAVSAQTRSFGYPQSVDSTRNKIDIATDWINGITIKAFNTDGSEVTAAEQWMQPIPASGPANAKTTISIVTSPREDKAYTGYLLISAGRLAMKVDVNVAKAAPKNPLDNIAQFNVAGGYQYGAAPSSNATPAQTDQVLRWAANHDIDQSGYYNQYVLRGVNNSWLNPGTLNVFNNALLNTKWHLPSKTEFYSIYPYSPLGVKSDIGTTGRNWDANEGIEIKGVKKTYRSTYKVVGGGIMYALRFMQATGGPVNGTTTEFPLATDNSQLCAYRYETKTGEAPKVQCIYLGASFSDNINTISNDSWWSSQPIHFITTRVFPLASFMTAAAPSTNYYTLSSDKIGLYWLSNQSEILHLNPPYITWTTAGEQQGGTLRPFSN